VAAWAAEPRARTCIVHGCVGRHLANGKEMSISGSDSYALLFLLNLRGFVKGCFVAGGFIMVVCDQPNKEAGRGGQVTIAAAKFAVKYTTNFRP